MMFPIEIYKYAIVDKDWYHNLLLIDTNTNLPIETQ